MSLKQKLIYKSSIGFSLGVFITIMINIIIEVIFYNSHYANPYLEIRSDMNYTKILLELLTGGILGCVGYGGAVGYEIEQWSIIRATATHFVVTMTVYVIVGLFNGWLLPMHSIVNVIQIGMMIFAYFMIWLFQYLIYKKSVKDLNKGVEHLKNSGSVL